MRIISWNINGIRAGVKKGAFAEAFKLKPDILCLQETKAEVSQLTKEILEPKGYTSFFSSSKVKKGYSGVAIYSKEKPEKITYGIDMPGDDDEGRTVVAHFKDFVLLNCYFPNGGGGPVRLAYKLEFYDAFLKFINKLKKSGKQIIFTGDVNTAHTEIDLARPKENEKNTGFLPEERAWIDEVINDGYVDVFRNFYPNKKEVYTYWDQKTRARERNVGWRIDYFFSSLSILPKIKSFKTHTDFIGSDHCPIEINLDLK
ncbi:MAG: Exodeoxyribonuclease [Patescibacteria group bacterium]|jgi:exodeoxyribonuclease-3|nr:Exodeoxyribonuclease [Patescibacteria group bacterium]